MSSSEGMSRERKLKFFNYYFDFKLQHLTAQLINYFSARGSITRSDRKVVPREEGLVGSPCSHIGATTPPVHRVESFRDIHRYGDCSAKGACAGLNQRPS